MRRRPLAIAVAVAGALTLGACGGNDTESSITSATTEGTSASSEPAAAAATVELKGVAFKPAAVSIKAGEAVAWHWDDGMIQHDVVFDGFRSKVQSEGTYEHTFPDAGSFEYHCSIHPQMKGTVEVTAG